VTTTHAALQAAFVDYGVPKNGFLHITDIRGEGEGPPPPPGRRPIRRGPRRPPRLVQNLIKNGQEVLVQVTRDEFGEKGSSLTMELGIPGRFLVLTPLTPGRVGVSKKIAGEAERRQLKDMLQSLGAPKDLGFIIRTAGTEMLREDLQKDLDYLVGVWRDVERRAKASPAPVTLYQESDLVVRAVRDLFNREFDEVIIDSAGAFGRVVEFFRKLMPRHAPRVKFYSAPEPLFRRYGVEPQIARISARKVELPSGGSIVIEQTEAMTTIDVNSGRLMRTGSPEETAFKSNLEAAEAIGRQLRLRDLGGVIAVDFIDVRHERHRKALEKAVRDAVKGDRSEVNFTRMPDGCLFQIVREKVRPSLETVSTRECPRCRGIGVVMTPESVSLAVLRECRARLPRPETAVLEVRVAPDVAALLESARKDKLATLERRCQKTVRVIPVADFPPEQFEVAAFGTDGKRIEAT
jgi:ribonuclease E